VFGGNIGGSGALSVTGAGPLVLSGNNAYSGGTFLAGAATITTATGGVVSAVIPASAPTVIVGSNTAFRTRSVTLFGATLLVAAAPGHTLANPLVLNGGVTFGGSSFGGSSTAASSLTFTGNVTLATTSSIGVNNATTLSGNISGPGGLNVVGSGNLTLSGNN